MTGGASSRRKGRGGENELAKLLGATRISQPGFPGPDLQLPTGHLIEVKRRNTTNGYALIDRLLRDTPIVAIRSDHGEWVIACRLHTWLDLTQPDE